MKKTCLLATLIFFLFGGMNLSAQTEIPVAEDLYALSLFGLELDLKPKPKPKAKTKARAKAKAKARAKAKAKARAKAEESDRGLEVQASMMVMEFPSGTAQAPIASLGWRFGDFGLELAYINEIEIEREATQVTNGNKDTYKAFFGYLKFQLSLNQNIKIISKIGGVSSTLTNCIGPDANNLTCEEQSGSWPSFGMGVKYIISDPLNLVAEMVYLEQFIAGGSLGFSLAF